MEHPEDWNELVGRNGSVDDVVKQLWTEPTGRLCSDGSQ
jgi:hypothetical protein